MAIQYNGTTIGTLTLCQKRKTLDENNNLVYVKDDKGRQVYNKYPIQIRNGNCLAIFLHIWKDPEPEDPERPWHHSLLMFFVDEDHLKRCLENDGNPRTFEDMFYGKLKNIKLNIYYKGMKTLAKYLTRDGYKVTCYYKEPKKK